MTGLLVHTLQKLESVDVGFQTSRLLVFGINPHATTAEDRLAFYRELMNRLRSVPLVESVTVSGNRIGSGWSNNTMAWVDGRLPPNSLTGTDRQIEWNNVGPKFFSTLGIRIIAGRDFADLDSPSSPAVAVVNETFAPRRR